MAETPETNKQISEVDGSLDGWRECFTSIANRSIGKDTLLSRRSYKRSDNESSLGGVPLSQNSRKQSHAR